jgi:FAD synthetase
MAEVLKWLDSATGPTAERVRRSLDVIDSALHVYRPDEVCFSFNGGKDSTAVFHLLRAACLRRTRSQLASATSADEANRVADSLVLRVKLVYFEVQDNFPEVEEFMHTCCEEHGLTLHRLPPFKAGLEYLIATHGIRAVFIGTRGTDPDGSELLSLPWGVPRPVMSRLAELLEHFSPTTPGWPPMMRVSPILRWEYGDVWEFLRACGLEFCKLYKLGFTSLGARSTSHPNPSLKIEAGSGEDGCGFAPAWELRDGALERSGRGKFPPTDVEDAGASSAKPRTKSQGDATADVIAELVAPPEE